MDNSRALAAALAIVALFAGATPAAAQPCLPSTLADYVGGTIGPCTIGGVTFGAFTASYFNGELPGNVVIPATAAEILVTPTSGIQGLASYVGFAFSRPGETDLQFVFASANLSSGGLLFGATPILAGGGDFEQILLASGSVAVSAVTSAVAQASLEAEDLGAASVSIVASTTGSPSATCTPATCFAGFDGGAFQLTTNAVAGGGLAFASISPFEVRLTYTTSPTAVVAEPGIIALLASGLLLLGLLTGRKDSRKRLDRRAIAYCGEAALIPVWR